MRITARRAATAIVAAAVLALAGCATAADAPAEPAGPSPASGAAEGLSGDLTIFAAASLKASFDELAAQFEAAHPDVDIQPISYDGSSTLATQIIEGARVDVFASADENNMTKVTDAGLAAGPQLFATNTLTIVTPAGNPGGVTGIESLTDPDVVVVLCAPEVPCGSASQTLLDAAGVTVNAASLEQNVTAVLTKIVADEADAGLVYVTDAATTGEVEVIDTAGADAVVNRYPIAALEGAPNQAVAAAFVEFVLGAQGREVLASSGFGAP